MIAIENQPGHHKDRDRQKTPVHESNSWSSLGDLVLYLCIICHFCNLIQMTFALAGNGCSRSMGITQVHELTRKLILLMIPII